MQSPFGVQKNRPKAAAHRANYARKRLAEISETDSLPLETIEEVRNALGESADGSWGTLEALREWVWKEVALIVHSKGEWVNDR